MCVFQKLKVAQYLKTKYFLLAFFFTCDIKDFFYLLFIKSKKRIIQFVKT